LIYRIGGCYEIFGSCIPAFGIGFSLGPGKHMNAIVILKFLNCRLKAMHRAPAYSRVLKRIVIAFVKMFSISQSWCQSNSFPIKSILKEIKYSIKNHGNNLKMMH